MNMNSHSSSEESLSRTASSNRSSFILQDPSPPFTWQFSTLFIFLHIAGISLAHLQGHSSVLHSSSCHHHHQHQHCQDYHGGQRELLITGCCAGCFIGNNNTLQPICKLESKIYVTNGKTAECFKE